MTYVCPLCPTEAASRVRAKADPLYRTTDVCAHVEAASGGHTGHSWRDQLLAVRWSAAWWDVYVAYLGSDEWAAKRTSVLERTDGMCEGCRVARATQVHHTTYKHVGDELLYELVAICNACHERLHPHMQAESFEDRWAQAGKDRT